MKATFLGVTQPETRKIYIFINSYTAAAATAAATAAAKLLQSCLTPCDPMDSSPTGCSVHRILQARILEWVAISFSNSYTTSNQITFNMDM